MTRQKIAAYPVATAGYSVVYQQQGWLGNAKLTVSIDVYDKGLADIPDGPGSLFVAFEFQNSFHMMGGAAPLLKEDDIDPFFQGAIEPIGDIDSTGQFRFLKCRMTFHGVPVSLVLFLTRHRGHFIKVVCFDSSLGNHASEAEGLVRFVANQLVCK